MNYSLAGGIMPGVATRDQFLQQLIDELDFLLPAIQKLDAVAAHNLALAIATLQTKAKKRDHPFDVEGNGVAAS